MNLPTRDDIEKLDKEVRSLSRRLDNVEGSREESRKE
jgi:hypothetical protein